MILLAFAVPAMAQVERPQRAAHGLFGAPPAPDADSRTTLDLNVSAFGAYDDNIVADQTTATAAVLDPRVQQSGFYSGLTVGAALNRTGHRFDFALSGGTNARYYPPLNDIVALGAQGGIGFAVHGRSRQFRVDLNAAHQPFYGIAPFVALAQPELGDVAPVAVDTTVQRRNWDRYGANAMFEQSIGRHSSLSFNYGYQTMEMRHETAPLRTQLGGAHFSHHLTSGVSLRLGYTYQEGNVSLLAARAVVHNLDAGVDYDKALGKTRRTKVAASFGSAIVDQYGIRTYRALGDASLKREIGRTWSARAAYHRGVGFLEGFNSPFFADSVSASMEGLLTHRLDLRALFAYTNGELGIVSRTNNFDTYSATTRLRFAFTQMLAAYGEYVAYRYEFSSAAGLPAGLPSKVDRQGVRAGLTLFLPMMR